MILRNVPCGCASLTQLGIMESGFPCRTRIPLGGEADNQDHMRAQEGVFSTWVGWIHCLLHNSTRGCVSWSVDVRVCFLG